MTLIARAERLEQLDRVLWWLLGGSRLDLDSLVLDSAASRLEMAIVLPAEGGAPRRRATLRIMHALSFSADDPAEVGSYETQDLLFDEKGLSWLLEAVPELTVTVRVAQLGIELVELG